ncbi:hypothetical protein [Priestia endophytica]|uniref:hypothetical protein n=1 Tax=Priestia endophytica TaxID=135735 RepID=UPI00124DAFF6|nr:hypothetical protein [Priestia endophytica]KAB2489623.1 hypothetical protein F8155_23085 [Priestia endophytica]
MEEQFIDKRTCKENYGSNLDESNITDFSTDNDEVVKVVASPFGEGIITRVLVKVGTEMEQTLIPLEDKVSIEYRDNVKIMSFVVYSLYSALPPFSDFFKSNFRGIGNGRGKCHPYRTVAHGSLGASCYTSDLNEDCVERDAFLNRCHNICEPPSWRYSEWYWEKAKCGECGNPPC